MDILMSIFILSVVIGKGYGLKTCSPVPLVTCPYRNSTENVILLDNDFPKGSCSSITIGNQSYIYDTPNIYKVWITIENKDKNCDLSTMQQLKTDLGLVKENVIFIEVKEEYFRMVFVISNNTINMAGFPTDFEAKLKKANFILFPKPNDVGTSGKICLNGGIINQNYSGAGYRCDCSKDSVSFGPRCEYLDRVLNSSIYFFNAFKNATNIQITFSLNSNGLKKKQSLVMIKNRSFQRVAEVTVKESLIYLSIEGNESSIKLSIDLQQWSDFYIDMSQTVVSLKVSTYRISLQFPTPITETFLSHYLVLKEDNSAAYSICIRNLKLNRQIVDLNNGDGYESCCLDRCQCKPDQDCDCIPFISLGNSKCYCKIGYDKLYPDDPNKDDCKQSSLTTSETKDSQIVTYKSNSRINQVEFKFRTLSKDGNLMTLFLGTVTDTIATKIEKGNLVLYIGNQSFQPINYNVSDGIFHGITLIIKIPSLEMILDGNANYSVTQLDWRTNATPISYTGFSLGPLYKPVANSVNTFTTCFSAIRINGASSTQYDVNLTTNSEILPQCSNGPSCVSGNISCGDNEVCNDLEWQNTKCICKSNFTSVDLKCIYIGCVNNPCQNGGDCFYNISSNGYQCLCKPSYWGTHCESGGTVAAALWWIAILVVLLLLLIILIVLLIYCCCCKKSKPKNPYIKEIYENAVIYNDQAGECDYNGPPIDYDLMKRALTNKGYTPDGKAPINPTPDLMTKKLDLDKNNNDLILDHPLEYGYEGYNSEGESVSSLGSESTNSQLNTLPLDNANNRFDYLNDLYK